MLEVGDKPQDFTLDSDDGQVHWASLRGKPVVVFFYPRANTPGCTTEAIGFTERYAEFAARGVEVLGGSADSVAKQCKFRDKHGLGVRLLSDPEHTVLEPWGVWGEKTLYGRKSMGIIRTTLLFDAQGTLVHRWNKVRVKGHVDKVFDKASELFAGG